jgi:thiamine-phosphate pyrophosphorylase
MTVRIAGLYAVTPDLADTAELCSKVEQALRGGARVLQYRNKTAGDKLRIEQAAALQSLCRRYSVPLIINDHCELAQQVGAAGVHLGGEDGSLDAARHLIGTQALLGASCYDSLSLAEAAVAAGADHVAFGSFFPSPVKPDAVRPPLDLLTRARGALKVPVVAIGGITADNAPALVSAGADAVAVISALFSADDIEAAARRFQSLFV